MSRAVLLLLLAFGCSERPGQAASGGAADSAAPSVEQTVIDSSYIIAIAKSTSRLETLAAKSGWADYFGGRYESAIDQFRERTDVDQDARFGAARSALGLASGFMRIEGLQKQLTPLLIKAQLSRPGSTGMSLWHRYVNLRMKNEAVPSQASSEKAAMAVPVRLLEAMKTAPSSLKFAQSSLPIVDELGAASGLTPNFIRRLKFRLRLSKDVTKATHKAWSRLRLGQPDIKVTNEGKVFELWDPGWSELGRHYYATMALKALPPDGLCSVYYRAQAHLYLDRSKNAVKELRSALAKLEHSQPLACVVLSDILNDVELIQAARVRLSIALIASGSLDEARAEVGQIENKTVAQKIRLAQVQIALGDPIPEGLEFDRDVYKRLFNQSLDALGKNAIGVDDVSELALVARYIDIIQRTWADTLASGGQPAAAARMRTGAQDKGKPYMLSGRNNFDVLMASALDYLRIGQPRVSLKYLTKLKGFQGITHGLAEQLRDVLSFRAMLTKDGNTATIGQ